MPREHWPEGLDESIKEIWHEVHGDRRTSLVCIGQELDHTAATAALDACLLTTKEMAAGEEGWAALPDPLTSVQVQAAQAAAAAVAAASAAIAQVGSLGSGQPPPAVTDSVPITSAKEKRKRDAHSQLSAEPQPEAAPSRQKLGVVEEKAKATNGATHPQSST